MTRRSTLNLLSLEARDVPAATVQFIHNSPFASAKSVDVYLNDSLYLDNFNFQSATDYLSVASATNLKIDIVPSTAANNASPLSTTTLNLAANSANVAIITGDPSKPTGSTAFHLATGTGRASASNANQSEILAFNGSPDLPNIDLRIRGVGLLGNDVAFGAFSTAYQSLAPTSHLVDILPGAGGLQLTTSDIPFDTYKGKTAIIMASGFLDPATATDPVLTLVAILEDGTSYMFGAAIEPAFAAAAATSAGGTVLVASPRGDTVQSIIAFPGAKSSPRIASADLDGDGHLELIVGSGPGMSGLVRILDGATGATLKEIEPFGNFLGGVNVAAGDITGDGVADIVLSPDDGGGPRVRIFNGKTFTQIADYFGIDDVNFRGGARAAVGDVNSDGRGDILVSAGIGGGPRVAVFDGSKLSMTGGPKFFGDFFAFEPDLRNGAFITAGDVNGDGYADMIVGGGPGGGPRVRVFDGKSLVASTFQMNVIADFFAGDVDERRGARVTAKDIDFDGKDDLITGGVPNGAATLRIFLAADLPLSGVGNAEVAVSGFNGASVLDEVFVG
ncbi:hypothetical protein BH11PLA2_BH11PLA2_36830 [soil metagenome]